MSILSDHFQIFIISLTCAEQRRAWMQSHLHDRGLEQWCFVDGIVGAELTETQIQQEHNAKRGMARAGRAFTRGEIGCALSHRKAYELMLSNQQNSALILEDDAYLAEDINLVLHAAADWLHSDTPRLLLLSPMRAFLNKSGQTLTAHHRRVTMHRAWNAHGYALNRAAAQSLIKENTPIHLMADDWVAYRRACNLEICGVDPFCIGTHELATHSYLEKERASQRKHRRSWQFRFNNKLEKLQRQVLEIFWLKPRYGIKGQRSGRPDEVVQLDGKL